MFGINKLKKKVNKINDLLWDLKYEENPLIKRRLINLESRLDQTKINPASQQPIKHYRVDFHDGSPSEYISADRGVQDRDFESQWNFYKRREGQWDDMIASFSNVRSVVLLNGSEELAKTTNHYTLVLHDEVSSDLKEALELMKKLAKAKK